MSESSDLPPGWVPRKTRATEEVLVAGITRRERLTLATFVTVVAATVGGTVMAYQHYQQMQDLRLMVCQVPQVAEKNQAACARTLRELTLTRDTVIQHMAGRLP